MNVTILSVDIKTVPTTKGSYQTADVAYKNNTFQGKVEGKKVMSFGNTKKAFTVLATASPGESYDITVVKNDKGYNDWVDMVKSNGATPQAAAPVAAAGKTNAAPKSNYETPEERAQRQVLIVRQSSLSSAVATLTAGAKSAPSADSVIALAKQFEAYVFDLKSPGASGFEDLPDFPVDEIPNVE